MINIDELASQVAWLRQVRVPAVVFASGCQWIRAIDAN